MPPVWDVRLLRSLTFRLALIYLALFTVSVAVLLGITYWASVLAPLRQVQAVVQAEAEDLSAFYRSSGDLEQLAERLSARTGMPAERKAFHALIGADGTVFASNLPQSPAQRGTEWLRFEFEDFQASDDEEHEVLARQIAFSDGVPLIVGRDTEDLDEREELIGQALAWGTGITIALGLAGGVLMSLAVAQRIEAINRTARRIIAGELSQRIAVRGTGDDFDRLSETLNDMLDRIEELIEAVSRVSDSIAHELRTPLTRLHADQEELIGNTATNDEERQRLVEQAISEVGGLQSTFDALLRIARIETGRHAVSFRDVNVTALLHDAAELYGFEAEAKHQRLDLCIAEGLRIRGDPDLLFQAVSNLLDNPVKYGPPESVVTLQAERVGNTIEVAVTDRGTGIPDDHRPRVIERFYRVPGQDAEPGVGLGLSLVAAVAHIHGSGLDLEEAEPGLRAVLRLPA